jgi:hypothetical protein
MSRSPLAEAVRQAALARYDAQCAMTMDSGTLVEHELALADACEAYRRHAPKHTPAPSPTNHLPPTPETR